MLRQIKLNGAGDYYDSSHLGTISFTETSDLRQSIKHKYPKGKLVISFDTGGKYTYNVGKEAFDEIERRARKEFVDDYPEKTAGKYYSRGHFIRDFFPNLGPNEDSYVDKKV